MANQQKEKEDLKGLANEEEDVRRAEVVTTGRNKKSKKGAKEKPIYTCDYCQKEFSRPRDLKQHLSVHTGQKDYHCNLCDYSASDRGTLNKHIRRHLNERPFKCPEINCGAAFVDSSAMKRHQLAHNKSDQSKKFSCSLCPYKTHRKSTWIRHMKSIHSNLKPFTCPHENCEYSAKRKSNLDRHILSHSQEKNHVCPHPNCGFKTKTSRNLKLHMRIHSNGEKRHKCRFCEFSSHRHGDLVVHIRRHTGEKPFSCLLCPYETSRKDHLNQHMKTHE